jgi:hypothetical protein
MRRAVRARDLYQRQQPLASQALVCSVAPDSKDAVDHAVTQAMSGGNDLGH